ncbi:hypothetical protein Cgig2_031572 [Carnegiea gigantea]|uniref:Uncharacterized protein n=1 Tax=Carnegiea gigantea TaxID=171969 RepID=A0A9Q1GNZ6_9CARY|nr:hypothetical protein Cgig2_031572 [Carnegiea gigantea]
MHDMGIVDGKTGLVVDREELDEDYNQCTLPPNNGRHLGRPLSKQRDSQSQDKKVQKCSKCSEVVVECTELVRQTQVQDVWHAFEYIYTLKLQTCIHDYSPRMVGSVSVAWDMLNYPLLTKNGLPCCSTFYIIMRRWCALQRCSSACISGLLQ